jgi:Arc/MetJ family transcription regulator
VLCFASRCFNSSQTEFGNEKKNPQLSSTKHNVFGIQVGVSINIFVKGTIMNTYKMVQVNADLVQRAATITGLKPSRTVVEKALRVLIATQDLLNKKQPVVRRLGEAKGLVKIADDFDEMPEEWLGYFK